MTYNSKENGGWHGKGNVDCMVFEGNVDGFCHFCNINSWL